MDSNNLRDILDAADAWVHSHKFINLRLHNITFKFKRQAG